MEFTHAEAQCLRLCPLIDEVAADQQEARFPAKDLRAQLARRAEKLTQRLDHVFSD